MLKDLSVGKKLGAAFGLMTFLMLMVIAVGSLSLSLMVQGEKSLVTDTLTGSLQAAHAEKWLVDLERLVINHIAEPDSDQKQGFEDDMATDKAFLAQLTPGLRKGSTDQDFSDLLDIVDTNLKTYFTTLDTILDMSRRGDSKKAMAEMYTRLDPVYTATLTTIDKLLGIKQNAADMAWAQAQIQFCLSVVLFIVIGLVGSLLVVVLSLTLRQMIRTPLKSAVDLAEAISTGDLTVKVPTKALRSKDEFGLLMRALDRMQGDMSVSVMLIETSSHCLVDTGHQLKSALENAVEATGSIGRTVEEVNGRVLTQTSGVTETAATITQIVKSIEVLRTVIEGQAQAVEASSSSIEEMVATIGDVSKNIERRGVEFEKLVGASDQGKAKLTVVVDKVKQVGDQSRKLLAANGLVKNIAARTNLLAMNAAIEAAHAGDAGLGFAVVADEIRNLAEMSARQSGEISKDVAVILREISAVLEATNESERAFAQIFEEVKVLNQYEQEIREAMVEQNQGSREILVALAKISEVTHHVRDSAGEITEGSRSIQEEMQNLASVSSRLNEDMALINGGTQKILTATEFLKLVEENNSQQVTTLSGVVAKFKI